MSDGWYLLGRVLWTVLALYLVLSGLFVLAAWAPDPNANRASLTEDPDEEAVERTLETQDEDAPLLEQWRAWVVGFTTGDLGRSLTSDLGPDASYRRPLVGLLADRGLVTLVYTLPAVVLSTALGTAAGLYAGLHGGQRLERALTVLVYAPGGVPAFVLAEASVLVAIDWLSLTARYRPGAGPLAPANAGALLLPMAVVAVTLGAVQFRYVRTESLELDSAGIVRPLRARGMPVRTMARHLVRNVAPVVLSLVFLETLGVLFFTAFVIELVFRIPGIGQLGWFAIQDRDVRTFTAVVMVPITIGLVGSLAQDVGTRLLDPRAGTSDGSGE